MSRNLRSLETRIDNIRTQLETKIQTGTTAQGNGELYDMYVKY